MITVHSMFFTLQGEGTHAGTPALFVRLAGCNVWNGDPAMRDERARFGACAAICDTEFRASTMEPSGGTFDGDVTDLEERLTDKLYALWRPRNELAPGMWEAYAESLPLVVFTGGEPSIQLHAKSEVAGRFLRAMRHVFPNALFSMETNGARMPHPYIQWVTLSPKHPFKPQPRLVPDEIKVLFPLYEEEIVKVWIPWVKKRRGLDGAEFVFVQPVDSAGCTEENTRRAVAFVHQYADLARLSVQTHKIVGVP